jgi:hypothetical protein
MSGNNAETSNYVLQHIPPSVVQQLEAGAFQSLVAHLQERSDQVQNIDLMTVSGFCRNCLAKVRRHGFQCLGDIAVPRTRLPHTQVF